MDVVVLAGGFGTRLRPWTSHMPKPLVPILDRAMIEHVVDVLPESLVTRVLIAAGYGIEQMREHFAEMTLPYEFHQYWLRVDDRDLERFLLQLTLLDVNEISELVHEHESTPEKRLGQKQLADEITKLVHGE